LDKPILWESFSRSGCVPLSDRVWGAGAGVAQMVALAVTFCDRSRRDAWRAMIAEESEGGEN